MYQIQHSPKLSVFFPALHAKDQHNCSKRSATHNLLDILLTKRMCKNPIKKKNSIKNHCITDWNNLKTIPDSELFLSKVKSYDKRKRFDQY